MAKEQVVITHCFTCRGLLKEPITVELPEMLCDSCARLVLRANPRYERLKKRMKLLRCSVCPPNKGENASRCPKHGKKKPRYKDKRK
jgi:hypothetical protein